MEKTKLVEIRKDLKNKKPDFVRSDYGKKPGLFKKWHRPKGITNKLRLKKRGYYIHISSGYRSPAAIRGFSKNGFELVKVNKIADLKNIDNSSQIGLVSGKLGQKKKLEIVQKAKELKIVLQNINDLDKYVKSVEEDMKLRKNKKHEVSKKKEQKTKEVAEKVKAKETEDKKKINEEKKLSETEKTDKEEEILKKEKHEKEKILTQKQ